MMQVIGAQLTNDRNRAHLSDLKREHLIDWVCIQEIWPPEKGKRYCYKQVSSLQHTENFLSAGQTKVIFSQ
jgi:hypothetical protein